MKIIAVLLLVFVLGLTFGRWRARASTTTTPFTRAANIEAHTYRGAGSPAVGQSQAKQEAFSAATYETVAYDRVAQMVRAAAVITVDETRLVHVGSRLGGWVENVEVKQVGTRVKAGDRLLTVYNPQWQQDYRALTRARMVSADGSRQQPHSSTVTDEELSAMQAARASQWRLGVYSPISGIVLERNAVEKQPVTPDSLYTIADLSEVWALADVTQADAVGVAAGQAVTLRLPGLPEHDFRGRVDSILPELDAVAHTVKVRIRIANRDSMLRPGMLGSVEIGGAPAPRLLVPKAAVLNSGVRQVVFVENGEGRLEARKVTTGREFGDRIEIVSGVASGSRVLASANFVVDSESQLP